MINIKKIILLAAALKEDKGGNTMRFSLIKKFIGSISIVLGVLFLITAVFMLHLQNRALESLLSASREVADEMFKDQSTASSESERIKARQMAKVLAQIAPTAIASLDLSGLLRYAEVAAEDPDISYVEFINAQNKILVSAGDKKEAAQDGFIELDIIHEDEKLGKVILAYNHNRSSEEIKVGKAKSLVHLSAMEGAKKTSLKWAAVSIIFVLILSMVIAMVVLWFLIRAITQPLNKMVDFVKNVSTGDLTDTVEINSQDEIGVMGQSLKDMIVYLKSMAKTAEEIAEGDIRRDILPKSDDDALGNAFAKMIKGLRGMVAEIRDSSDQIASASSQIAATTDQSAKSNEGAATAIEEVTTTVHELSTNIQNVARSTQNQASAVTQTSSSIEEMVTSISRVADTSERLRELSQKSIAAVASGNDATIKSANGIEEVNKVILRSAETISALGSRAKDIGRIVEVIGDIAEQTNLLALNAAIEAARAGEQGLGFAVVAEEVRKLAERSAASTKEIGELIASIQQEALDAVSHMEKSTAIARQGINLSGDVSAALKKIEEAVSEAARYSQEISAATQEQSAGGRQISKAAGSLNEITQEINSATEEQSSGTEQVVKAMEKMKEVVQQNASGATELAVSADQLSTQGERLQEVVSRFILNGAHEESEEPHAAHQKKEIKRGISKGDGGDGKGKKKEFVHVFAHLQKRDKSAAVA